MKWFKKWFAKKCKEAWENSQYSMEDSIPMTKNQVISRGNSIETIGMNFTVYRASGGYVLEHRMYDRKTDRNIGGLHVITDNKDLGEEIGKIITFEQLKM